MRRVGVLHRWTESQIARSNRGYRLPDCGGTKRELLWFFL